MKHEGKIIAAIALATLAMAIGKVDARQVKPALGLYEGVNPDRYTSVPGPAGSRYITKKKPTVCIERCTKYGTCTTTCKKGY